MKTQKWLIVFMLTALLNKNAAAQTEVPQLTAAIKTEVIGHLSSALLNNYVFPDTGRSMAAYIGIQLKNGAYDEINSPNEFAAALTSDLHGVYKDLHLMIVYNHSFEKNNTVSSYIQQAATQAQVNRQQNYGFSKAEILTGNIGYVAINRFFPVNWQSTETVNSVFSFLKNCYALIIDLRDNPGGDAWMVNFVSSFFFIEKTHVNDMYDRRANQVYQYWTAPVTNSIIYSTTPVYILVNARTFSGAEGFAYGLQSLHKAIIIGENTAGGAHPVSPVEITHGFMAYIPFARAINPITKTNWETTGVEPDIKTKSDAALDTARLTFYDRQINILKDTDAVQSYQTMRDILNAKVHPYFVSAKTLRRYVGNYNGSIVTFENNGLYFKPSDGYKIKLYAISQTIFAFNNWELNFIQDRNGVTSEIQLSSINQNKQTLNRANKQQLSKTIIKLIRTLRVFNGWL